MHLYERNLGVHRNEKRVIQMRFSCERRSKKKAVQEEVEQGAMFSAKRERKFLFAPSLCQHENKPASWIYTLNVNYEFYYINIWIGLSFIFLERVQLEKFLHWRSAPWKCKN